MADNKNVTVNIGGDGKAEDDKGPAGTADFRFNDDVKYSNQDLKRRQEMLELELREEKADTQRRMAWTAMIGMLIFTAILFGPLIPDTRVQALADLLGLFYVSLAGVVGAYMGFTSWMSRK